MKKVSYFLLGMLLPFMFANCTTKSSANATDQEEGNLLNIQLPQIEKFVIITNGEAPVYKEADTNSPTLMTPSLDFQNQAVAVLGEESDFYRISDMGFAPMYLFDDNGYYENFYYLPFVDSSMVGYIPKSITMDVKAEFITAEWAEEKEWTPTLVVKEGKYKNLVLRSTPNGQDGEAIEVGVLVDGVLAFPQNYSFDIKKDNEVKGVKINEDDGLSLCYSEDMIRKDDSYVTGFDPKKLSEEQIEKICELVTKQEPEQIMYEYCFPLQDEDIKEFGETSKE